MFRNLPSFVLGALAFACLAAFALANLTALAFGAPQHYNDPRVCYSSLEAIPRDAHGDIKRSAYARAQFVKRWPCPVTGEVTGACPGWSVNHTIPLAQGGCDAPHNMDWMPNAIKSCADPTCRDRWERKVYKLQPAGSAPQ